MKITVIFVVFSIVLFGCGPAKKVQKVQEVISKVDTTPAVVVANTNKVEKSASTKDILDKVLKNKIDFTTFSAKVRVAYESKEGGDEATAYVRLKKDSAMWLSMRGALGIEGFRVLITKDSVKVMNLLKKNVEFHAIGYLQEITGIPFDFATLQDLVVGNPVFIDTNIVSYNVNANNQLVVLMSGKLFKNLVSIDNSDYKILHSKLEDANAQRNLSCEISFSDYETAGNVLFAKSRKISVGEQSKTDLSLDFKQYSFSQPLTFPFNIPKNYKRL